MKTNQEQNVVNQQQNVTVQEPKELTLEQQLNLKRKEYQKGDFIYKLVSTLLIIVSLAYSVGLFMGFLANWDVVRVVIGVVLLLGIFFSLFILPKMLKLSTKYKSYSFDYKTLFLKPVIESEFSQAEYKESDKISTKEVSECSLIKKARSAVANDCVSGNYGGVDFTRFDMELSYGKSKNVSDCVLIVCNNKTVLSHEIQLVGSKFSIGKNAYEKPEKLLPYITGDDGFDKKFKMYVENREDADKVLDKDMQKRLSKFSAGGPFAVFFDKKKVYLIIRRRKDSLEAPVYKAAKEATCRKEAEKEVAIIKKWIDLLNEGIVK